MKVGDTITVSRTFSRADVEEFTRISGDRRANDTHTHTRTRALTRLLRALAPFLLRLRSAGVLGTSRRTRPGG